MSVPVPPLSELVRTRRVIVCCGTGGVGKTTVAAALALAAARSGRRTALVTIDPAQRLADALGLAGLDLIASRVPLEPTVTGELWALMLDARRAFDRLVEREAPSAAQAARILANPFYRNIADSLSGTQEYMAVETLHDLLHGDDRYDLVVVDTPPTRNALDFLDAPRRLTRLLDNAVFRALMRPTRAGMRVVGAATQVVLRSIGKVVGGDVVADAVTFFQSFEGMEAGFRSRALATLAILGDETTGWVLVSSGRGDSVEEALYFADQLRERGHRVDAAVANRLAPRFAPLPPPPPVARERAGDGSTTVTSAAERNRARARLGALRDGAQRSNARADAEDAAIAPLAACAGGILAKIPARPDDVHDLASVAEIAALLSA